MLDGSPAWGIECPLQFKRALSLFTGSRMVAIQQSGRAAELCEAADSEMLSLFEDNPDMNLWR